MRPAAGYFVMTPPHGTDTRANTNRSVKLVLMNAMMTSHSIKYFKVHRYTYIVLRSSARHSMTLPRESTCRARTSKQMGKRAASSNVYC